MSTVTLDLEGAELALRNGDKRIVSRCLTWIEDGDERGEQILDRLGDVKDRSMVVGVTGVPGAGKSTLIPRLASLFNVSGGRPAVLAVDPSSPLTGGALLGDRTRYDGSGGEIAFFRSVASRGSLGGLARTIDDMISLLAGAGFSPIFVETVGTGQSEVAISRVAHTTVALFVPGLGDGIQAIKAGLMEVADIIAVTKSDVDPVRAGQAAQTLKAGLALGKGLVGTSTGEAGPVWQVPVCVVSALSGDGTAALAGRIEEHYRFLAESGRLAQVSGRRRVERFRERLHEALLSRLTDERGDRLREAERQAFDDLDRPARLVARLLDGWGDHGA